MLKYAFLALSVILAGSTAYGADNYLINIHPPQERIALRPGVRLILPGGGRTLITESFPDGKLRTDSGLVLSPEGVVLEGEHAGTLLTPEPEATAVAEKQDTSPKKEDAAPEKPAAPEPDVVLTPQEQAAAEPPDQARQTVQIPHAPAAQAPVAPEEGPLTLAQMLPMTTIKDQPAAKEPEKRSPEKPAQEKSQTSKRAAPEPKKPKQEAGKQKAKPGDELRIPPEAAKNGNLDFLEGCWQGTRPEYFSKRTIRECFCFGPGGKNGKRRIFDTQNNRRCIGATQAHLSGEGVLSVTSEGAACSDGEQWGQAEMVCRNSGPHTPCSWIFRDANNGRQAYTIPFVRVESCGR